MVKRPTTFSKDLDVLRRRLMGSQEPNRLLIAMLSKFSGSSETSGSHIQSDSVKPLVASNSDRPKLIGVAKSRPVARPVLLASMSGSTTLESAEHTQSASGMRFLESPSVPSHDESRSIAARAQGNAHDDSSLSAIKELLRKARNTSTLNTSW